MKRIEEMLGIADFSAAEKKEYILVCVYAVIGMALAAVVTNIFY